VNAGRTVIVDEPYESPYAHAVRFKAGEHVLAGGDDPDWPGWVWTTSREGRSGWAPLRYLLIDVEAARPATGGEPSNALATRDYDGTELTVAAGTVLEVIDEESGWLWCRAAGGELGWLPAEHTRPADEA
jgi:hypothetical protein